jgi:hypothetical protein
MVLRIVKFWDKNKAPDEDAVYDKMYSIAKDALGTHEENPAPLVAAVKAPSRKGGYRLTV